MELTITDKAVKEIKRITAEQKLESESYLRLRVVGGGCSGWQFKLDLDEKVNEKLDDLLEVNGVKVVVDKRSAMYVDGSTVDYHDDLNKMGFSVDNSRIKSKCGCGSSFSY